MREGSPKAARGASALAAGVAAAVRREGREYSPAAACRAGAVHRLCFLAAAAERDFEAAG